MIDNHHKIKFAAIDNKPRMMLTMPIQSAWIPFPNLLRRSSVWMPATTLIKPAGQPRNMAGKIINMLKNIKRSTSACAGKPVNRYFK